MSKVLETTVYDNCLESTSNSNTIRTNSSLNKTLTDFFDEDDISKEHRQTTGFDEDDWRKHWVGMPEYEQTNNNPYKKIIVTFRNKSDYDSFAELLKQKLTDKTKSIWYPKLEHDDNSLKRWIEE